MNPFEELSRKRKNLSENNNVEKKDDDLLEAKKHDHETIDQNMNDDSTSNDDNKDAKSDDKLENKLPPAINTYMLFSYFPIVIIIMIFYIITIGKYNCPTVVVVPSGLIVGYAIRFTLNSIFKHVFIKKYVKNHLEPFMTKIYGNILTTDELIKMVSTTNNIIRDRTLKKNHVKTVSRLEKDYEEFLLLGIKGLDNRVKFTLLVDGESVPGVEDQFFANEVRKLLVQDFYMLWNFNLNIPEEFSSISEDGVFQGTIIFEDKKDAMAIIDKHETLDENNLVRLETRGEKFRFLNTLNEIRLNVTIHMKNGEYFMAPSDALLEEFQNM